MTEEAIRKKCQGEEGRKGRRGGGSMSTGKVECERQELSQRLTIRPLILLCFHLEVLLQGDGSDHCRKRQMRQTGKREGEREGREGGSGGVRKEPRRKGR
eukprot:749308-Hanusia_phi.AAC.1